jgi:DNA repair photolyase
MRRDLANPRNRFLAREVQWDPGEAAVKLEVIESEARSIVSQNDSPDVPFKYGLNPYQGCYHGCAYCYARPTHQYLGMGAGTDFERRIVVKTNAPELLAQTFARPSWKGELLVIAGNTDCYQPLEAEYQLTRRCLEVCLAHRNPVAIITKGGVALRDVDLLADLARVATVQVFVTIPFAEQDVARVLEPFAAPIAKRFEILRRLSAAGVRTGISLAPIIPGLNDADIAVQLELARDAGVADAFMTMVRLVPEVAEVFFERIRAGLHPARVRRVEAGIREARGGALNNTAFGARMAGSGHRWRMVADLFDAQCRRLGLNQERVGEAEVRASFVRPRRQLTLFD